MTIQTVKYILKKVYDDERNNDICKIPELKNNKITFIQGCVMACLMWNRLRTSVQSKPRMRSLAEVFTGVRKLWFIV